MKNRRIPVVLALVFLVAAVLLVLPSVVPPSVFSHLPGHTVWEASSARVRSYAAPTILGEQVSAYAIPSLLAVWAVFLILARNAHHYWWMIPYSAVVHYTFYVFSQLFTGGSSPEVLLDRLSAERGMGLILLVLLVLLELTLFILLTIVSVRLNRKYRRKRQLLEAKAALTEEEKPAKLSRSERKAVAGAKKQRRKRKEKHPESPGDEQTMVSVHRRGDADARDESPMTYPVDAEAFADEPLVFPEIRELPKLRKLGHADDVPPEPESDEHRAGSAAVYIGSVKVREDSSVLLADTPLEDVDSPDDEPIGRTYDPIPSLRKQFAEDAATASMEIPPTIPLRDAAAPADAKPQTAHPDGSVDLEEEQHPGSAGQMPVLEPDVSGEPDSGEDMDMISGIGGLVSSAAGTSALLTRNRLRYNFPSEDLLESYPDHVTDIDDETREAGEALILTLRQFKIEASLLNIVKGPTVTMYEVSPAPGVRVSSIISLSDNIALQLAARQVRIVAPIPGKQAVGIEVPNKHRSIIGFKDLLPAIDAKNYQLPLVLGRKITGEPVVIELTQTPHLLIAGATGSGKSVCVNSLISSILFRRSPKDVRLILVDPKIVELRVYNGIPHLLTPVITEPKKTIKALEFCLYEMDRRYKLLNALAVRNIGAYNKKIVDLKLARERLPFIVVVIDEFADLMTTVGKELETLLARLAAMARAVGIHLVLATQRPSANVITGIIKSNIPTRIAFMVASQIDSRIIIDETGAEKLLGKGDMLFAPGWDPNSVRIQGAFLSDEEVERVVAYAKTQGEPDYLDEVFFEDEEEGSDDGYDAEMIDGDSDEALMEKALKIVVERQSASASYLQRRLRIGYNRAARLVEQMEDDGYVGPSRGSKPRELLKYPD